MPASIDGKDGSPVADRHHGQRRFYLLLSLLLIAVFGCSILNRYIFILKKELPATPEKYGIAYQEVWFPSAAGPLLNGWFIPSEQGRPLIVFFHGNAGNLSDNLGYIRLLHGSGFPIFIFDYRGFGKSEGTPLRENDLYQDARGALSYLARQGWRHDGIIMFGQSLGAAVALQMALEAKPAGLVMESSFTSIAEVVKYVSPLAYFTVGWWSINFPFDNAAKIGRSDVPLLLIHGDHDPVVPVEMTRRLFVRARDPKMLYIIDGGGHCDVFERDFTDYLAAWDSYQLMIAFQVAKDQPGHRGLSSLHSASALSRLP